MLPSHAGMNSDAISDETINISHRLEHLYDAIETGKIDLDELHNLFNNSSLAERKAFIQSFVKEVKVTGDEVLLTYAVPLASGLTVLPCMAGQNFSIFSTMVTSGGTRLS